ncbi:hypothetical protein ElyMa_003603900 [Elysia marginata]|uniref:Uncharacterized protein n=1 Tax=Elysia marginata TaxID=1093978 RepID=A0AAV4ERW1_9GAST|nr:hypothetical protein ElyMa_003603900 [Elysia marginata]
MEVRKKQALAGCACVAVALLFMVVGFSSPYWVESFEEFKSPFVRLGLWEFCFNDFTFYKDFKGNRYLGCFYIFSREARPIWEWVSPPWFISVQVMVSTALLFIFLTSVALILYQFKLFPKQFEFVILLGSAGFMLFCVLCILVSLIVFGVYKEDRRWMPRPDMNLLSWAYGFTCVSGWFCLFAAICLALAGKASYNPGYKYPPVTTYT